MSRHVHQPASTESIETRSTPDSAGTILKAVAMSAKELLRSTDFEPCLPTVIERIGYATKADRVHILVVDPAAPDQGRIVQRHLWNASGISTPPPLMSANGSNMIEIGLQPWLRRLAAGEAVVGHVKNFEESTRAFLAPLDVKSVAIVPIFAADRWWGHIGLHDCRAEREWSPAEIDALKTLAELIGAAIVRTGQLKTLADASRIIESSPTILYRVQPQRPFPLIYLSQNIRRYGFEAEEFMTLPGGWLQVIDKENHAAVINDFVSIAERQVEQTQIEFRARKPDGSLVWFDGRAYAVRDEQRRLVAIEGVLSDITDRKIAAEKIAMLARTDSLTGLANRAAFLERLNLEFAQSKRSGKQFAVHYLDLDHFKEVNDTLGHPIGDALLRAAAERMRNCVRETDLVARFGGDEFAVLQDNLADSYSAEILAAKIARTLAMPYALEGNQVRASASIGIVSYGADIANIDAMMTKADLALYRAKNEGRNQFSFHAAELDRQNRERITIGEDLRLAIARGEFELFYQPESELESSRILGLEASVRWNHPTRGMLLPEAFIPIAETSGTISAIGEWAIENVCRQIRAWTRLGIVAPLVGLDVSSTQFKLVDEIDRIVATNLARFHVAPERLELKLTEPALVETPQRHRQTLRRLRQLGVRIAIDDFGSCRVSLDSLQSFGISRLKIDGRFIAGVPTRADDAAIVRATIALAHELDIEVLAGGVETAAQAAFLVAAGCPCGQGAYVGVPLPADATSALLRRDCHLATA